MSKLNNMNRRGDTIIEVMISLAVLGLAFAVSYATANHALGVAQNNQEHSKALQVLKSQVELARSAADNPGLYNSSGANAGKWFCLKYDSSTSKVAIHYYPSNNTHAAPTACKYPVNNSIDYVIYISYDAAQDAAGVDQNNFEFTITWPGLGGLGQQQEQINYKLHRVYDE